MSQTGPPPTQEFLDQYSGLPLLIIAVLALVMCVVFVGLRFFCRLAYRDAPMGWDDWLMIPALFFQAGMSSLAIVHVKWAYVGWHIEKVVMILDPEDPTNGELLAIARWGKVLFAIYFFWNWACVFPRLSVLALYLRIFAKKNIRIGCYILMAWIVAYGFAFQLAAIFACTPVQYAWNRRIEGKCFNIQLFFQLSTVPLILSDPFVILLPIREVLKLEMTRARRVGVVATFLTGIFGFVASIIRFALFFSSNTLSDPTWASSSIILWTTIEPAFYCLAGCLVALRPLVGLFVPEKYRTKARNFLNRSTGHEHREPRSQSSYMRGDPAFELGAFNGRRRWQRNGFGPLGDTTSQDPAPPTEAGAFAETASVDEGIESMAWPSREFEDAIQVKKEVWVSRSPWTGA